MWGVSRGSGSTVGYIPAESQLVEGFGRVCFKGGLVSVGGWDMQQDEGIVCCSVAWVRPSR